MSPNQYHRHRRSSRDSSTSESSSTGPDMTADTNSSDSTPSEPVLLPSFSKTSSKNRKLHPDFENTIQLMAEPLAPFVNCETGQPHPEFPRNHLSFYLLTSEQLDRLARHFHQVWPPHSATDSYPFRIRAWLGVADGTYVDVATKRQRFGYFIGMPGYSDHVNRGLPLSSDSSLSLSSETIVYPAPESSSDGDSMGYGEGAGGDEDETEEEEDYEMSELGEIFAAEEEIIEWMAREWEAALRDAGDQNKGTFRKDL